jgi:hypothetical protein
MDDCDVPDVAEYVPDGHAVQLEDEVALEMDKKVPAAQGLQLVEPTLI